MIMFNGKTASYFTVYYEMKKYVPMVENLTGVSYKLNINAKACARAEFSIWNIS